MTALPGYGTTCPSSRLTSTWVASSPVLPPHSRRFGIVTHRRLGAFDPSDIRSSVIQVFPGQLAGHFCIRLLCASLLLARQRWNCMLQDTGGFGPSCMCVCGRPCSRALLLLRSCTRFRFCARRRRAPHPYITSQV